MLVKNLEVNSIVINQIDSRSNRISLQINFSNETPLLFELSLEDDYERFIDKILKQAKAMKKPLEEEENYNEVLVGVSIVNIKNEEEIKEKVPKRFCMLERKLDNLRQTKNYKDYVNLYAQMSTMREVIYERSN